jgi:hypothetical protein
MKAYRLRLPPSLRVAVTLAGLGIVPALLGACGGGSGQNGGGPPTQRITGQTAFQSAPPLGQSRGGASFGAANGTGGSGGSSGGGAAVPAPTAPSSGSSTPTRAVQETDLYRVDGNRLYYLNAYRGLMVFDVTNPDAPALIGRSPIFGDPQEMFVQNGIAVVVVADWYGADVNGLPFHGSIVRGLDATDPANIKVVGEAQLGGYVQDTRIVGNVLYAVVEDYGWEYGWGVYGGYGGGYPANPTPKVAIASVSFANGVVTPVARQAFSGTGGVFNVTPNSIMLAFQNAQQQYGNGPGQTDLQYVDISDPGGAIKLRGQITIDGAVNGWGPDNGRWNLDFADGVTAHGFGCSQQWCGGSTDSYILSTVDFSNPDAPAIVSTMPISSLGWSAAARFSGTTLYLSPSDYYSASTSQTPLSIYDLSKPASPTLAGTTSIPGSIWMYIPDGTKLFSIGSVYSSTPTTSSSQVSVDYIDVSNPASPKFIGTSTFGQGWAWTPAADTFKAFTINDTLGLAVIPFSGWDYNGQTYSNGVQLVQYSPTALIGGAAAHTKGWVQRGIFVNNRLYSLSDESLGVVDYSNPAAPRVVKEVTLARNVVNAQPQGSTIAELSSDWWGNDVSTTEMRVLPIANAAETTDYGQAATASIAGVGAQVFQNGTLAYVVTIVQEPVGCPTSYSPYTPYVPRGPNGQCYQYAQQVQVVDTSGGGVKLRGSVLLPSYPTEWYGWGWFGYDDYSWYGGADVVQVGSDALAFRRWFPQYANGPNGLVYEDSLDALFVVDLSNPDAPAIASTAVTVDPTTWWGNLQAVGNTLYATHYEWVDTPNPNSPYGTDWYVRYYLDTIDLSDRAHPHVGSKVNIPGIFVGASSTDPSLIYTIDYRWNSSNNQFNELDVLKLDGQLAYLQSQTQLDGWVGNVIVQGTTLYTTAQQYDWTVNGTGKPPIVELHQIDLSNPQRPADRIATQGGWGWLLAVVGDRAVITSGWGESGVDIYRLSSTTAPTFEQTVRTLGWWTNSVTRQANTLYLTSGYWGVQPVVLQ